MINHINEFIEKLESIEFPNKDNADWSNWPCYPANYEDGSDVQMVYSGDMTQAYAIIHNSLLNILHKPVSSWRNHIYDGEAFQSHQYAFLLL